MKMNQLRNLNKKFCNKFIQKEKILKVSLKNLLKFRFNR